MSYLRALDAARSHLDRGDLLAAEAELERAHDEWRRSRVRAPLVERGLEPALRRFGRWFGRKSTSPVLPVFGHRATRLEDDLRALARLLHDEALRTAGREAKDLVESDRQLLERALRLDRRSRIFGFERPERWDVLHGYLEACRRLARSVDEGLLPTDVADATQEEWLGRWAESVLSGSGVVSTPLLRWLERQAAAVARLEGPGADAWSWIAARGALRDPEGGERALAHVERALRGDLDETSREAARRALAGLLVNEGVLAVPGADAREALERWTPEEHGAVWPPPEIAELLDARTARADERPVASVVWSGDAANLVVVLHRGSTPLDALAVSPRVDAGEGRSRFEASLPEVRGWLRRWLPDGTLILADGTLPAGLAELFAWWQVLDVEALVHRIDSGGDPVEETAPVAPHPLWSGPHGHPVFRPLADRARSLVPRLRGWIRASPSFTEPWGRDALGQLADHGLELCGLLRQAIERLDEARPGGERRLQTVDLVVPLQWPRLETRDWPMASTGDPIPTGRGVDRSRRGTIWHDRPATPEELVDVASSSERAELLTASLSRARDLAARSAARIDPRRVSVAPRRVRCPEAWLRRLDDTIRTAVGASERQLHVLALWKSLAETPNGDPDLPGDLPAPPVPDAVCGDACRLTARGGCWPAQIEGRREAARVWVVPIGESGLTLEEPSDTLFDDPRTWTVGIDDTGAADRLAFTIDRARAADRSWVWVVGGVLDPALRTHWNRMVPVALHQVTSESREAADVVMAPPGYRPGDPVLGEWSERVLERRIAAWRELGGGDHRWWEPVGSPPDAAASVEGAGTGRSHRLVVTARLAGPAVRDPLLLLLRATAGLGHAAESWVCLDPRLAHVLGSEGGWFHGEASRRGGTRGGAAEALDASVASGRDLLTARGVQAGAAWTTPLDADRLRAAAAVRDESQDFGAEALARTTRDWARGRPLIVGGATDRQRDRVVRLVRELSERSGDGGPLGVRCVVVVGTPPVDELDARSAVVGPGEVERLGAIMLEAERGRLSRVDLHPLLLLEDAVREWAQRVSSVAWVFVHGEEVLATLESIDGPASEAAAMHPWRDVLERSGAGAMVFVDAVESDARSVPARWAAALDARVAVVETGREAFPRWRLEVEVIDVPALECPECGSAVPSDPSLIACPACGRTLPGDPASERHRLRAFENALVRALQRPTDEPWWAIGADADLVQRLRSRLGFESYTEDQAPLLAGVGAGEHGPDVLHVEALRHRSGPPPGLLWIDCPRSVSELEGLLLRLTAMEAPAPRLRLLLPPVGARWAADPRLAGRWRWTASRTEVEFRLRGTGPARSRRPSHAGLRPEPEQPFDRPGVIARRRGVLGVDADRPAPDPSAMLDALDAVGPVFGAVTAAPIDEAALPADVDVEELAGLLDWARRAEVIERVDTEGADVVELPSFERAIRGVAPDATVALADVVTGDMRGSATEEVAEPHPGAVRASVIGGEGERRLRDDVERAALRGDRVLVVVAHPGGRLRWEPLASEGADVVDIEELALAFLDASSGRSEGDVVRRLLPVGGAAEGEEVRLRLMRGASRRYVRATGNVPAIEAQDLRRVVQGEAGAIAPGSAADVDLDLLARCAAQARAEAGWMTPAELRVATVRAVEREAELVERWRRRYRWAAVDGAHDVPPDLLEFVRALFPTPRRWELFDPLLMPSDADVPVGAEATVSATLPREWVGAIETLRRSDPALPSRLRTTRRGRGAGTVERVRVLTLQAAAEWVIEQVPPDRAADRTGVVVGHEHDRAELRAALERAGHAVVEDRTAASWLASGPRHLLAALRLVVFEPEAGVLDVLARLDPVLRDADHEARLQRWIAAETDVSGLDVRELRLARLHRVRERVDAEDRLVDAAAAVLDSGILDPLLGADAASGRLRDWLADHGSRSVAEVLARLDSALVVDPVAPGRGLHLLAPDDLAGPDHDHVIAIGTGYELPARLVRVLLRARRRVSLLYSERDPLA